MPGELIHCVEHQRFSPLTRTSRSLVGGGMGEEAIGMAGTLHLPRLANYATSQITESGYSVLAAYREGGGFRMPSYDELA